MKKISIRDHIRYSNKSSYGLQQIAKPIPHNKLPKASKRPMPKSSNEKTEACFM